MEPMKATILRQTHYGINIYSHVLRKYYPNETVLKLGGRICHPARNPFNHNKHTLLVEVVGEVATHVDLESAVKQGDCFDFAAIHYQKHGLALYEELAIEMNIGLQPAMATGEEAVQNEPSFSFFKAPIHNVTPTQTQTIWGVFDLLTRGGFQSITEELRGLPGKPEASKFKARCFDYVTFSGVFKRRANDGLINHSGLLTVDFDELSDPVATRDTLLSIPEFETELLFTSPSGNGLKWIIPIELSQVSHSEYFTSVANFLHEEYGLLADPSGKDVARACFLCHDPHAYIHSRYYSSPKPP